MTAAPSLSTDPQLAEAASRALACCHAVPRGSVRATAHGGWISLEGQVEWLYQRAEAYRVVRSIPGATGCVNHVSVAHGVRAA